MRTTYVAGGDESDAGNDWLVFVRHVNGDDFVPFNLFQDYIEGEIDKRVDKLPDEDKYELWRDAVDDLRNPDDYLKEMEIEEDSDEFFKTSDATIVINFLY